MSDQSYAKYSKSDLARVFGATIYQMDTFMAKLEASKVEVPRGQNPFNQHKIYTDETIAVLEKSGLKIVLDPSKL